jgi:hypothetical protein
MFVQKLRNAIIYDQLLFSEEQQKNEALWRGKKLVQYADDMTVFEEVGMKLQKLEELHTKEVDSHMQNIVRVLDPYRVAFFFPFFCPIPSQSFVDREWLFRQTRLSWKRQCSPSDRNFEQCTPRDGPQRMCYMGDKVGTCFLHCRWDTSTTY